jgi:hypothetical protein
MQWTVFSCIHMACEWACRPQHHPNQLDPIEGWLTWPLTYNLIILNGRTCHLCKQFSEQLLCRIYCTVAKASKLNILYRVIHTTIECRLNGMPAAVQAALLQRLTAALPKSRWRLTRAASVGSCVALNGEQLCSQYKPFTACNEGLLNTAASNVIALLQQFENNNCLGSLQISQPLEIRCMFL